MGMFDKPKYLTGDEGFVSTGDVFWLHNAKIEGTANVNGEARPQAKLLVSHLRDDVPVVVFTSGKGITGQVARMDASDRQAMPMEVRLDGLPSGKGNPTNVIVPADAPPQTSGGDFEAGF
jgi:hypothetical protein